MSDDWLDDPAKLRAIADDTYDWESWMGPDGATLWVNRAVQRLTGVAPDECLAMAQYPLPLVHPEDRGRIRGVLHDALEGSSGNDMEFRVLHRDGGSRWVAMSWQSTYSSSGEYLGFRTSVRDIDDRKRLELRLSKALARAEAADRAKTEFLAMMSHELRTPLQCAAGYAELLLRESHTVEHTRQLRVIQQQTGAVMGLVDDILHVASMGLGRLPLRWSWVDARALVEEVTEASQALVGDRDLQLRCHFEGERRGTLRVDEGRLRQALLNLVGNALKFSERGVVEVSAQLTHPAPATHARLRIQVRDQGPGIDPDQQERIFDPFTQADSTDSRTHGGAGLGLAIARGFVRAMGGDLHVESALGQGACFTLELEAEWSEQSPPAPSPSTGPDAETAVDPDLAQRAPARVLVVDDSGPSRVLLCELLRLHGYAPEQAADGKRGLELAQSRPYDVVFIDLQMPRLTGREVADAVRASGASQHARLVACTANLFDSEAQHEEGSFDEVLVKPVLCEALQRVMGGGAGSKAAPVQLDREVTEQLRRVPTAGPHPHLLAKLATRVRAAQPELERALAHGVAQGDPTAIRGACHTLRGNCLLVGGRVPADACARLHDAADNATRTQLDALHAEVVRALTAFTGDLQRIVEGETQG